ncbi:hypothetical protein LEP3755_35720 [Leptolyngbya sp. NIES-3755]|nr:hypothetical protein LEP3755_35720 [Leptolyngbya sp. NIES-3755]
MIIVDTGAFVALFDRRDSFNAAAQIAFSSVQETLITTYPVITETCYFLGRRIGQSAQINFLRGIGMSTFEVFDLQSSHIDRAIQLMESYADLPMDFADASLVVLYHLN